MSIQQTLANIYGEFYRKQDCFDLERKDRNRLRNKQKTKFIAVNNKVTQECSWLSATNPQINTLAIKYLESHRPSIKERVVRIYSSHRQSMHTQHGRNMQRIKNAELRCSSIPIHHQSFTPLRDNPEIEMAHKKPTDNLQTISKPCKISARTLTRRSHTEVRCPKNQQQKCLSRLQYFSPKKVRAQTANASSHEPVRKNGSFTGWEFEICENGSFLH